MKSRTLMVCLGLAGLAVAGAYAFERGWLPKEWLPEGLHVSADDPAQQSADHSLAPAVSVARVHGHDFVETVMVTGSLVAREEILVAPEVEGLRVLELKAEEGDRVRKGDVLAVLVSEQLEAQIAQKDAALASADAAIAQAGSQIAEAEARLAESTAALERARPLVKSQYLSESVFDQREAAAKTAAAQLTAAKVGLTLAETQKGQVEAQRRELLWRRSNTEVKTPADGIVSRRSARVGSIAVGAFVAGGGESLFRIIKDGEIELDAEVAEAELAKVMVGQRARVEAAGLDAVEGKVRLVMPEVDKASRLGRVRIFLGDDPALKIGSFARAQIETAQASGLAVPQSAILYGDDGPTVQVVEDGKVATRRIETGLRDGSLVEVRSGLADGDSIVAKAGTFLRDGDAVRPVAAEAEVSEAKR